MTTDAYQLFLEKKKINDPMTGISQEVSLRSVLKPHQRDIVKWALRRGRAAIFAGTGLGKTLMELSWAEKVSTHTGKPVILFAPLAVAEQHISEADKFGIRAKLVSFHPDEGIGVTNYQKMDHFDLSKFGGAVLDESSILKSTDGKYRTRLINECASIPFRLAATATPAPNDFMELGNHAEFLSVMSYTDMLATFFTHDGGDTQKWRLKGHAETEFWKWMASWSVMLRNPSDLGYPNDGYDLPPLNYVQHTVSVDYAPSMDTGLLFPMEARTLQERISARRDSVDERVALAHKVVIGRFGDKLASWHGNQNTQNAAAKRQKKTPSAAKSGTSSPLPISKSEPNTCENTGSKTLISGNGRQTSVSGTTPTDEIDTPAILNSPRSTGTTRILETEISAETSACGLNMASGHSNMTKSSQAKEEDAQSAPLVQAVGEEKDFTLTTATIPVASEEYCAQIAIKGSENSMTNATGLLAQSNTSTSPILDPWVIWCHLNSEQDALEKAFGDLAISIHGSLSDDEKIMRHNAWLRGDAPILIVKPSMFAHGLNWQHCSNCVFVGLNDSFEQVYQAVRRFWRFGQTKPVNVHFIASEMEGATVANIRRKEADADRMAASMVMHMADLSSAEIRGSVRDKPDYNPTIPMNMPKWLCSPTLL